MVFDDVASATNALRQMQGFPFYDKPMVGDPLRDYVGFGVYQRTVSPVSPGVDIAEGGFPAVAPRGPLEHTVTCCIFNLRKIRN